MKKKKEKLNFIKKNNIYVKNNFNFINKIKKSYIIFLIKIQKKKKIEQNIYFKKNKLQNILFLNIKKIKQLLINKIFIRMNVYRKRKNVFLNFSNILSGKVYTSYSCGHYFKRSLRKTYYAIEALLLKSNILEKKFFNKYWLIKKKKKRIWLFLVIKGDYFSKGFKKNLKNFIWKRKKNFKIYSITNVQFKAHNGVRKKSKRRK